MCSQVLTGFGLSIIGGKEYKAKNVNTTAQSKTCEHNGTKHKAKRKHNETKHKQKREQNGTEHKMKHVKRERHKATLVNPFVITLQLYRNVKECKQIRKGSWTC